VLRPLRATRATLGAWFKAIASLGPEAWKWAGLITLFEAILNCALIVGERRPSIAIEAVIPLCLADSMTDAVQVVLGLCAWAIADRSGVAQDRRARQLAVALSVAVLLQAVLVSALTGALFGHLDWCVLSEECKHKDWSKVPWWLWCIEDSGQMLVFGGLAFAWLEMHRRGHETEQRLLATQQERERLRRSAFDARLTAMRARIDPQFLFDSLADVQAAYASDKVQGAATLDLLIAYLRTALPRLRAEGSTIGAEAELVEAWLAVVAARRDGRPARQIQVDPDCFNAPFPATVLLPMVQWAAGDGGQPGCNHVSLQVQRLRQDGASRLQVKLRVVPGRSDCDDDPELGRIRERLRAMYGEAARLTCAREAIQDGRAGPGSAVVVTLLWPDEGPNRGRS
jgi:hypothetical protein